MAKKKVGSVRTGPTKNIKEILEPGVVVEAEVLKSIDRENEEAFDRYKKMIIAGFTQQEIIDTLKISQAHYYVLANKIPEDLRVKWRASRIMSAENALHMSSVGFTKVIYKETMGKEGQIETLMEEKYFPPNTNSIKYYLNNMSGGAWKDKSELVVNELESMPMAELERKVKKALRAKADKFEKDQNNIKLLKQGVIVDS